MLQMVLKNLYTAGMMITSDRRERISTRNTVTWHKNRQQELLRHSVQKKSAEHATLNITS
jgi:hypothetical protein